MIDREFLHRLRDTARVDLYASGIDGARCYWPWRMNKAAAEADDRHGGNCDHYVVDSNFKRDDVTNTDVLDEAAALDADAAVLADVYHNAEATVDALLDGLEWAASHPFNGTLVLPLQPPHAESAAELEAAVDGLDVWWGIGGLKDAPAAAKLDAARDLRRQLGKEAHIHGFGFGVTPELARAVREDAALLDSIDNSTAVSSASIDHLTGCEEKMTVLAAQATAQRLEDLRMLTPFADPDEATTQMGMEVFAADD